MVFTDELIDTLMMPISDQQVCGTYLKADRALFRPLRNEFNVGQTSLRKLAQNPDEGEVDALLEENRNNWHQLSSSLKTVFSTQSRDIELAGWMLAAQLIVDESGHGAANVVAWLDRMVKEQWDELNPVLPEAKLKATGDGVKAEQYEAKVKAFFQICGDSEESSLIYAPLLMLPLVGNITFFQYQSAERKGEVGQLRQIATQALGRERTNVQNLVNNLSQITHSLLSISEQVNGYTRPLSVTGVNFTFAMSLLSKVTNAIQHLTGIKAASEDSNSESVPNTTEGSDDVDTNNDQSQPQTTMTGPSQAAGELSFTPNATLTDTAVVNSMNRDKAFHQLREISEYFRVSEPHSPVSFLLEKAIRWGYMSLPDLMTELMAEKQNDRDKIFNIAGLDQSNQTDLPDLPVSTVPAGPGQSHSIAEESSAVATDQPSLPSNESKQSNESKTASSTSLRW